MSRSTPTIAPELQRLQTRMFSLPVGVAFGPLRQQLEKRFEVEEAGVGNERRTYYDTFDWRLHRRDLVFFRSGSTLCLDKFDGSPVARGSGRKRARYFSWDLESEVLREELGTVVAMRALCPVVELAARVGRYRIMNRDRKTVARLVLRREQVAGAAGALPELIVLSEIRGYHDEFHAILQCCLEQGCLEMDRGRALDRLLESSGRTPRDYGDKFTVDLDDNISIGEALATIGLQLLEIMERNRPGVMADIDSEFLHDFRIAVRRTRSLLSLTKNVLPPARHAWFREEFRWLGSVTGNLRDIDVYLLERGHYLNLLPAVLRDGMDGFFERLQRDRDGELRELKTHLESTRYLGLRDDWLRFLGNPDSEIFSGVRAQSCRAWADATIVNRFEKFLRQGGRITAASRKEEMHRLRIAGKKFRYLLEFFRAFYDCEEMAAFVKQMKELQDNLGAFNDLSVQQGLLGAELDRLRGRNLQAIRFAAALGGLMAVLAGKRHQVRAEFEATYAAFAQPQVQSLLREMVTH